MKQQNPAANTRAIALHQTNRAITALRECNGLAPIDDPLPGAPPGAFQIIRKIITSFPPQARRPTEAEIGRLVMGESNDQ
jgi:hypothetical protein